MLPCIFVAQGMTQITEQNTGRLRYSGYCTACMRLARHRLDYSVLLRLAQGGQLRRNYPRGLRSASHRWNIALNARRALANLEAFSRSVTAVEKSITFILLPPNAPPCWQCYLCSTMRPRWRHAGMISIDRPRASDQRRDFSVHVERQIEPSRQVKNHHA
jgi:hypothetical protein